MDKSLVRVPERFKDHKIFNQTMSGTNFGFLNKRGYYSQPEVLQQPRLMVEMGINWVTLNMNICMDTYYSSTVYLDCELTVGEMELQQIGDKLKEQNIGVIFKPCLTPMDGQWMGAVAPPPVGRQIEGKAIDYVKRFFDSYKKAIVYSAQLAERLGFDSLMIGAELEGIECYDQEWREVIQLVRLNYSGPITYEYIPFGTLNYDCKWFEELDYLSFSYYPAACPKNHLSDPSKNPVYTMEQMKQFMFQYRAGIQQLCERFGNLPVAFTEYGVRSAHGCIQQPFNYTWETDYNGEEQADYLQASLETFYDLPNWMGFLWWKWDETQHRPHYHTDPKGEKGFTIQGKPAEQVFRKWFKK